MAMPDEYRGLNFGALVSALGPRPNQTKFIDGKTVTIRILKLVRYFECCGFRMASITGTKNPVWEFFLSWDLNDNWKPVIGCSEYVVLLYFQDFSILILLGLKSFLFLACS